MNLFYFIRYILIKILTYLPYIGLIVYIVRVLILKIAPAKVPKGKKLTNELLLMCVNQLKKEDKNSHSDYVINSDILGRLKDNTCDYDNLRKLLDDITAHVGLNGALFVLKIKNSVVSDRAGEIKPGVNDICITLDIKEEYDAYTVISVMAHEVMHQYLYFNGIYRKDAWENEILTDTAVVYCGFYEYMKLGYEPKHGVNPFSYSKVGYISTKDIEFIKSNI